MYILKGAISGLTNSFGSILISLIGGSFLFRLIGHEYYVQFIYLNVIIFVSNLSDFGFSKNFINILIKNNNFNIKKHLNEFFSVTLLSQLLLFFVLLVLYLLIYRSNLNDNLVIKFIFVAFILNGVINFNKALIESQLKQYINEYISLAQTLLLILFPIISIKFVPTINPITGVIIGLFFIAIIQMYFLKKHFSLIDIYFNNTLSTSFIPSLNNYFKFGTVGILNQIIQPILRLGIGGLYGSNSLIIIDFILKSYEGLSLILTSIYTSFFSAISKRNFQDKDKNILSLFVLCTFLCSIFFSILFYISYSYIYELYFDIKLNLSLLIISLGLYFRLSYSYVEIPFKIALANNKFNIILKSRIFHLFLIVLLFPLSFYCKLDLSYFILFYGLSYFISSLFFYNVKITTNKNIINILYFSFLNIYKLFFFEKWQIGFYKKYTSNISNISISEFNINDFIWFPNPKHTLFTADPFIFSFENKTYIVFERMDLKSYNGVISIAEINVDSPNIDNYVDLTSCTHHRSFPFPITIDGNIFLIIEEKSLKQLCLYRLHLFPFRLEFIRYFFTNVEYADCQIIFNNNCYLIFVYDSNFDLKIYSVMDIFNDIPNEIFYFENSNLALRGGGSAFYNNDLYYRFLQNCTEDYGKSIMLNVGRFSNGNFTSHNIFLDFNIKTSNSFKYHTFSIDKNLVVIDRSKISFAFIHFFYRFKYLLLSYK